LLKAFGHAGAGIFPGPTVIEKEIARQYQVRVIGNVPEIRERYYAISVERRLRHPAVVAIGDRARHQFFA
jgi:LysR family transcriptional activator of nhaA